MAGQRAEAEYPLMTVSCDSFSHSEMIPVKFTCDGEDVNPQLRIGKIPEDAVSLAVIVDDPDAPGKTWVHWVMWNIGVTGEIPENSAKGIQGVNDFRKTGYNGPCPPSGTHRYVFKVYALDTMLPLKKNSTKPDLLEAMRGHIVGYGELTGLYKRR